MNWCILRTSGPRTLPLVRSLRKANIVAWTPTAQQRKRRPRSDNYRDVAAAVLPTFAFARAEHLPELLAIQHAPISDHPPFTVLQHRDRFPLVADEALEPLRQYEEKLAHDWEEFLKAARIAQKKSKRRRGTEARRAYVLGQIVRVPDTAFEGLDGEIIEVKNNGELVLSFHGFATTATVDSCLVEPIHLSTGKPEQARAA
jgi:hypothetical protein